MSQGWRLISQGHPEVPEVVDFSQKLKCWHPISVPKRQLPEVDARVCWAKGILSEFLGLANRCWAKIRTLLSEIQWLFSEMECMSSNCSLTKLGPLPWTWNFQLELLQQLEQHSRLFSPLPWTPKDRGVTHLARDQLPLLLDEPLQPSLFVTTVRAAQVASTLRWLLEVMLVDLRCVDYIAGIYENCRINIWVSIRLVLDSSTLMLFNRSKSMWSCMRSDHSLSFFEWLLLWIARLGNTPLDF